MATTKQLCLFPRYDVGNVMDKGRGHCDIELLGAMARVVNPLDIGPSDRINYMSSTGLWPVKSPISNQSASASTWGASFALVLSSASISRVKGLRRSGIVSQHLISPKVLEMGKAK